MSDTKHSTPTPGPWRHEHPTSLLVLADGPEGERILAGCWAGPKGEYLAEGIANAALIATSQLLVAALEEIDSLTSAGICVVGNKGKERYFALIQDKARAALSAARPPAPATDAGGHV